MTSISSPQSVEATLKKSVGDDDEEEEEEISKEEDNSTDLEDKKESDNVTDVPKEKDENDKGENEKEKEENDKIEQEDEEAVNKCVDTPEDTGNVNSDKTLEAGSITDCDNVLIKENEKTVNSEIENDETEKNQVEEHLLNKKLENNSIKSKESSEESEDLDTSLKDSEEDIADILEIQATALLDQVTTHEHAFDKKPEKGDIRFAEFEQVISNPIWIEDIRVKVSKRVYSRIADVVADIRLMLENTYRFFGAYHSFTKRALKLEQALEQRIALFSNDIRAQCALEASEYSEEEEQTELPAILRKKRSEVSSRLLRRVMFERNKREKVRRQKYLSEPTPPRESMTQRKIKESLNWEQEILLANGIHEQIKSMWELAQIGQWLGLAETALHIEVPSQWEIERMLLLPQESHALASVMTALLTPPNTRIHLPIMPPMPYRMWTHKLNSRVTRWYRMKPKRALETNGIEPRFWDIVGLKNPLEQYAFHELSLHQRVWLLKSLCDNVFTAQKAIRECIAEQNEEETRTSMVGDDSDCLRATILGEDGLGRRYITFPGLMGREVRIYREDSSRHTKKRLKEPSTVEKTPKRRKRSSGWKNGQIVKRKKKNKPKDEESDSSSSFNRSRSEDEPKIDNEVKEDKKTENEPSIVKKIDNDKVNGLHEDIKKEIISSDSLIKDIKIEVKVEKTEENDDFNEMEKSFLNNTSPDESESKQIVTIILEEIISRVISDNEDDNRLLARAPSLSPLSDFLGFDVPPASAPSPPKIREPLHQAPDWLIPDCEEFYLVADNLDTLRALAIQVNYDTASKRTRGSSEKETKLAKALQTLAEEYETWELEIESIEKTARDRLFKDYQDSKKRPKKYVDPNERIWQEFLYPVPVSTKQDSTPKVVESKTNLSQEELSARSSRLLRRQEEKPPAETETNPELETSEEAKREFHFRKAKIKNEENLTLLAKEFGGVIYSDSESLDLSDDEEEDDGSDTWLPPEEKRRRAKLKLKSDSEQGNKDEKEMEKESEAKNSDVNNTEININKEIQDPIIKKEPSISLNEQVISPPKIQVSQSQNQPQTQSLQIQQHPTIVNTLNRQRPSNALQNNTSVLTPKILSPQTSAPIQRFPRPTHPHMVTYSPRNSTPNPSQVNNTYSPRKLAYVPTNVNSYSNVRQNMRLPAPIQPRPAAMQAQKTPVIVSTVSLATNNKPKIETPRKRRHNITPKSSPAKVSNISPIVVLSDDDDIEIIEPVLKTPNNSPSKLLVNRPNITITPVKKTPQPPVTPPSARPVLEPNLIKHFSRKGVDIFLDPRSSRAPNHTSTSSPSPSPTKTISTNVKSSNDKLIIVNTDTGSHYALLKPDGSKVILTQNQLATLRAQNGGTLLPLLNR